MTPILFKCSNTGKLIQFRCDQTQDRRIYEAVNCPQCGQVHLVNKKTGRPLAGPNED